MIIFLLTVGLIISLGLNISTFILVRILLKKIGIYENYIKEFKSNLVNTVNEMRKIDTRGTFATRVDDKGKFESDDEVGVVFKDLMELIEKLNKILE